MCTNVHSKGLLTTRSTVRELLLSLNGPGRPDGRPIGQGPVFSRLSGRTLLPTVKNLTIGGRLGGRLTAGFPAELDPNGYIFEAYKLGLFWAVLDKIFREFSS